MANFDLKGTFKKRGCPGWGANPGPPNVIYFLMFTTLPLSHSGSKGTFLLKKFAYSGLTVGRLTFGVGEAVVRRPD
jgi:hypothetical protein